MKRAAMFGSVMVAAASIAPAVHAQTFGGPYGEYPAPEAYPFQRSVLTAVPVVIPHYEHQFRVRVYSTPPRQPLYNVPPYAVITPY